jgi:seryl-tRNA synthetase
MINIDTIRTHPELIKKSLKKRNQEEKIEWVELILKNDKKWRQLKQKADKLRQKRNALAEEINKLKKAGKPIESKIRLAKDLPGKINEVENELNELKEEINSYLYRLPNILHESVPEGKSEEENLPFKFFKEPKTPSFDLKAHSELLEKNELANFESGRKNAGQGFNYLLGDMTKLDLAIQRLGLDILEKKGFNLIGVPLMLNKETLKGAVNLEDFRDVIYKIEEEDLYLIGTGEHPLVSLFKNKTFNEEDLPLKLCTLTPCFRKEIGGHGVDSKGIFRMHQFYKVEQVVISTQEDSYKQLEKMQKISEDYFKKLNLPFRVVEICAGDLGSKMAKQYDIEAWFPREQKYKEVTSAGNTADYQSTKLNIKYLDKEGNKKYVHMLNNTMVATSRAMVAILENYQQEDGTVIVPKALRKYMNGKKILGDKKNERKKRTKFIWRKS